MTFGSSFFLWNEGVCCLSLGLSAALLFPSFARTLFFFLSLLSLIPPLRPPTISPSLLSFALSCLLSFALSLSLCFHPLSRPPPLSSLLSTARCAGLPELELPRYDDRRVHRIGSYESSQPDLARYRPTPHTFPCLCVFGVDIRRGKTRDRGKRRASGRVREKGGERKENREREILLGRQTIRGQSSECRRSVPRSVGSWMADHSSVCGREWRVGDFPRASEE